MSRFSNLAKLSTLKVSSVPGKIISVKKGEISHTQSRFGYIMHSLNKFSGYNYGSIVCCFKGEIFYVKGQL